jgi:hypothetical protein
MKRLIAAMLAASMLSACASSPDKISPSYVSPLEYSNLDCDQIRSELVRVSDHVREASGVQARAHTRDQVAMGVGLVVFWPALFFLMEGDKKEELGRLKGQYDALDDAAIRNKCPVASEMRAAKVDEPTGKRGKHHGREAADQALDSPAAPRPVASPDLRTNAAPPAPQAVAVVRPTPSPAQPGECGTNGFKTPYDPSAIHRIC